MQRGEIRLVDLEPTRGAESNRRRPAVLVSNDGANAAAALGRGVVTVVPVTSSVERVYPFQVLLAKGETGLARDSKAQAEQVRSVAAERIGPAIGRLTSETVERLDDALRLHLAL